MTKPKHPSHPPRGKSASPPSTALSAEPARTFRASWRLPRVPLPAPRYARTGLADWCKATALPLALPPGPPESWTSLLSFLGLGVVLGRDHRFAEIIDETMARALMTHMGFPSVANAGLHLLLSAPVPAASVPNALLSVLRSTDNDALRAQAAVALGQLGVQAARDELFAALTDPDYAMQSCAAVAFALLEGPPAARAIARLPWAPDVTVNVTRLWVLERLNAWDQVASQLGPSSPTNLATFVHAVVAAEEEQDPGQLLELLTEDDLGVKRNVADVLAGRPALAAQCVDAMVQLLRDDGDDGVVIAAAEALAAAGEAALEPVAELLTSESWRTRMFACLALGASPELAQAATDELRTRLTDDDRDVRREASLAVLSVAPHDLDARRVLRDDFDMGYDFAARLRARAGNPALAPWLAITGAHTPDRSLWPLLVPGGDAGRPWAAMALALVDPDTVAPALERLARSAGTHVDLRSAAAAGCLMANHPPRYLGIVQRLLLLPVTQDTGTPRLADEDLTSRAIELGTLAAIDSDRRRGAIKLLLQLSPQELRRLRPLLRQIYVSADSERAAIGPLLGPAWHDLSLPSVLARMLAPGPYDEGFSNARAMVRAALPEVATALTMNELLFDSRSVARAAARRMAQGATERSAPGLIECAMVLLTAKSDAVRREGAADLLAGIARELWPEDRLEAADKVLRDRALHDEDGDVQAAARRALELLGRKPAEPEPAEELAEES